MGETSVTEVEENETVSENKKEAQRSLFMFVIFCIFYVETSFLVDLQVTYYLYSYEFGFNLALETMEVLVLQELGLYFFRRCPMENGIQWRGSVKQVPLLPRMSHFQPCLLSVQWRE